MGECYGLPAELRCWHAEGETMSTSEQQIAWEAPGPGHWALDPSHFRGGTTPIVQSIQSTSMTAGMRRMFADLGTPVDTLQPEFVNGFCYTRLRPLISPDKPAAKLPPLFVLKVATRLHPEMRRRAKTADRTMRERPWRAVIRDWHTTGRAAVETKNLAFQDRDLRALSDAVLIAHVNEVLAHNRVTWEQHFWLHGYDLGPIGFLLQSCAEWGIRPADVIPLLEGASPSTTAPMEALNRIREAIQESGADPASLADVRAISPEVAALVDKYLRYRGALLFSRYDLDGVTLGERPDLVLSTIMSSTNRAGTTTVADAIGAIRSRVPEADRAEFDERLREARAAMDLRDDNGPNTAEWPLGLLRLALLEVGRRMVLKGLVLRADLAFEITPDEITPALLDGTGPAGQTLTDRAVHRAMCAGLRAPEALGVAEVAPPTSVLPHSLGRLVDMVQLVIEQMGMSGDHSALGSGLKGSGVGVSSYRGIARRAGSPEEALDLMEPGNILVVPFTTPAYNVVLAIAGGIVTAVGGPLSHAAVLARELGIPAVIGAPNALIDINDGDEIEVDPIAGEVRVLTRV